MVDDRIIDFLKSALAIAKANHHWFLAYLIDMALEEAKQGTRREVWLH